MNIQQRLARECNHEFGPNHEHDERECARMLYVMGGGEYDDGALYDGLAYALNREAEERTLGRPLFPNEY